MSTEIYYFSGTGNSLHVAKELQQRIPDANLIPVVSLLGEEVIQTQAESVGFVFPIHLTTVPIPMREFVRKLDLSSAKYIFAVGTRIGTFCLADIALEKALKESKELQKEREQILTQRQALGASSAPSFKPLFAERVMNRIETLGQKNNGFESFYQTLLVMFRRFAIVGAAILLLLLIYNLQTGDILSSEEIMFASDFTFEEILDLPLF